jgi:hypothetical protein
MEVVVSLGVVALGVGVYVRIARNRKKQWNRIYEARGTADGNECHDLYELLTDGGVRASVAAEIHLRPFYSKWTGPALAVHVHPDDETVALRIMRTNGMAPRYLVD